MAGKGARTHARILDTHTMCKQTNVRKTVTENGDEHEPRHRFDEGENDRKIDVANDDDDFNNSKQQ